LSPEAAVLIYNFLTMLAIYLSINPSIPALCITSSPLIQRTIIYPSCPPIIHHALQLSIMPSGINNYTIPSFIHCSFNNPSHSYNVPSNYPSRPPVSIIIQSPHLSIAPFVPTNYPSCPPLSINYTGPSFIHGFFNYPSCSQLSIVPSNYPSCPPLSINYTNLSIIHRALQLSIMPSVIKKLYHSLIYPWFP
jgi:hypothetical protein